MEEKNIIYDEMCRVLTDYENKENEVGEEELYSMLVKIQNNWESVIAHQD